MASQDEQESQIESVVYYIEDELSSLPDQTEHTRQIDDVDEQQADSHIEVACSDDTVPGHEMLSLAEENAQRESCFAFVQDTQFVGVELDTQASDCFDRPLAMSDIADRSDSSPRITGPSIMQSESCTNQQSPLFKRPATEVHFPRFQFGPGPNPGTMKLTRTHPGTTSSVDHQSASKDIASHNVGFEAAQNSRQIDGVSLPVSTRQLLRTPNVRTDAKNTALCEDEINHTAHQTNGFLPQGNITYKRNNQNYKIDDILPSDIRSTKLGFGTCGVSKLPFDDVAPKPKDKSDAKHLSSEIQNRSTSGSSRQFPHHETASTLPLSRQVADRGSDQSKPAGGVNGAQKEVRSIQPTSDNIQQDGSKSSSLLNLISKGNFSSAVDETSAQIKCSSVTSTPEVHLNDENQEISSLQNYVVNGAGLLNSESTSHRFHESKISKPVYLNDNKCPPQCVPDDSRVNKNIQNRSLDIEERRPNQANFQTSASGPLVNSQSRQVNLEHNESLHSTHGPKAIRKANLRSKSKNGASSVDRAQTEVSGSITAMEMLQMAMIQAGAEKVVQNTALTKTRDQEVMITGLQNENNLLKKEIIVLMSEKIKANEKIDVLNFEKIESVETINRVQARYIKYKEHMNDVINAQKQLHADAETLRGEILKVAREKALELDESYRVAQVGQYPVSRLENFKDGLKEARKALANERQISGVLRRDLSNLCTELQQERALRKSLKDNDSRFGELKSLLSDYVTAITSNTDSHENNIQKLLLAAAGNETKLDICLTSINDIKEGGSKSDPKFEELQQLVEAFSAKVENRLMEVTESGGDIHRTILRILSQLEAIPTLINATKSTNMLLEENSALNERILAREVELAKLKAQVNGLKKDLETCRSQMATTYEHNKGLGISRDDTLLRSELVNVQNNYLNLKEHAETSRKETEKATSGLRVQEESSRVLQKEIVELRKNLQQAEAKISAFSMEKEVYVQKSKKESDTLRVEMERNAQSQLKDETAQYVGTISALRRQLCESKAEILQKRNELDNRDQLSRNAKMVVAEVRVEIENIRTRISEQSTDLDLIEDNLRTKDEGQISISKDVQSLRVQLTDCQKNAEECRERIEGSVLQFAQHCEATKEKIQDIEKDAEAKISQLEDQLAELHRQNAEHKSMKDDLVRCLQRRGLLASNANLEEWAAMISSENFREMPSFLKSGHGANQECSTCEILEQLNAIIQPESLNKDTPNITPKKRAASVDVVEDLTCCPDVQSKLLSKQSDKDSLLLRKKNLLLIRDTVSISNAEKDPSQNETSVASPVKKEDQELFRNESNTSAKLLQPPYIASARGRVPFPALEIASRSLIKKDKSGNGIKNSHKHTRRLDKIGTVIIPDSQEVSIKEQSLSPVFTQPVARITQGKDTTAVPQLQETDRTITRTEVTAYSVRSSKTYENTPGFSQPIIDENGPSKLHLSNEESLAAEILSECSSLTSLSDVDFDKFLDHHEKYPQLSDGQHSVDHKTARRNSFLPYEMTSLCSASDGVLPITKLKEGIQQQGIKLPKSILKRTSSVAQTPEAEAVRSWNQSLEFRGPSRAGKNNIQRGANRRQSGQPNGINTLISAPYNRIVSGLKVLPCIGKERVSGDVKCQTLDSPIINDSGIGSSPIMEQPQRNVKKRSLSKIAADDRHKSVKLQRVDKH